MFSQGFLGTSAPFFLDFITIYFAILPILLAISITFAIKGMVKTHFISQGIIIALTLLIVVTFEIGIRISGGFLEYSKNSNHSFDFLLIFLVIHIFIAIIAIAGWLYLFISSYKSYKKETFDTTKHRKIGTGIFFALTVSCIMGVYIYIFLFVS